MKKKRKTNLSKGEQKAMEEFTKRKDIIITGADKSGAVVITDIEKYINKPNCHLSDKSNYNMLQEDPALQYIKLVLCHP